MKISNFEHARDNDPKHIDFTWEEFAARLGPHEYRPGGTTKAESQKLKEACRCFSPAEYPNNATRSKKNVLRVWMLVLDVDHIDEATAQWVVGRLQEMRLAAVVYSSWSHARDPWRFRVVIPLDRPVPGPEWSGFWARAITLFNSVCDEQCKDASRIYFGPFAPIGTEASNFYFVYQGAELPVDYVMSLPLPAGTEPEGEADDRIEGVAALLGPVWPAGSPGPSRHKAHRALAGMLLRLGIAKEFAVDLACAVARAQDPDNEDREKRQSMVEHTRQELDAGEKVTGWTTLAPMLGPDGAAILREVERLLNPPLRRGDHVELAHEVIAHLRASGPVVFDDGQLHRYTATRAIWEPVPLHEQEQIVMAFAGKKWVHQGGDKPPRPLKINQPGVQGTLKCAWSLAAEAGFFARARVGMVFTNGFVEVDAAGIRLLANGPEHRARFGYPFDYEQEAVPQRWWNFLDQVFRDDSDKFEKACLLQEYGGMSLVGRATKFQKALITLGEGANGKSVAIQVIEAAMPPGSTIAVPPQSWGNEYRAAMIAGKLMNLVSELPEADILDSEALKTIISGDSTTGRHIFKAPFTFRARAGHAFAANRLPAVADPMHGFWRRWLILTFNRIFAEHEQNKNLAEEIISAELPAIVAVLIQSAQRALQRGGFLEPPSSTEALLEWRRRADQVAAFASESLLSLPAGAEVQSDNCPGATWLYECYQKWAEKNGHKQLSNVKFGMRMKALGLGSFKAPAGNFYPVGFQNGFREPIGLLTFRSRNADGSWSDTLPRVVP